MIPQPPIIPTAAPTDIRIEGKALVFPCNFVLPRVCAVTGGSEDLVLVKRTFYWHHPAVYCGVFAGLLIYVILALVLRKTATVQFYMTRMERSYWRRWLWANWGVFLLTFVSLAAAGTSGIDGLFWLAPVFLVSSLVIYFAKVRKFYPQRIDDRVVFLRGISPAVMQAIVG